MIATIYIWEIVDKILNGSPISFTAGGELVGSVLLLLGLLTRLTCLLFIIRLEYAQFLTCLFLFVAGPGRRSLDFRISTANKIYRMT